MKSEQLIVDFPSTRRFHEASSPKRLPEMSKTRLRFSTSSRLHIYERQEVKDSEIWYSDQDVKLMKVANRLAARDASAKLFSRSSQDAHKNTDPPTSTGCITVTGLERLLTSKSLKKSYATRRAVRAVVLEEQERQYRSGEEDQIKIRSVAARYSEWSTKRAHTIALYTVRSLRR